MQEFKVLPMRQLMHLQQEIWRIILMHAVITMNTTVATSAMIIVLNITVQVIKQHLV